MKTHDLNFTGRTFPRASFFAPVRSARLDLITDRRISSASTSASACSRVSSPAVSAGAATESADADPASPPRPEVAVAPAPAAESSVTSASCVYPFWVRVATTEGGN